MTFSSQINTATAHDYFMGELDKLVEANGRKKYEQAANLVEFVGSAGEGMKAGDFQVKRFSKMELKTTSAIAPMTSRVCSLACKRQWPPPRLLTR